MLGRIFQKLQQRGIIQAKKVASAGMAKLGRTKRRNAKLRVSALRLGVPNLQQAATTRFLAVY